MGRATPLECAVFKDAPLTEIVWREERAVGKNAAVPMCGIRWECDPLINFSVHDGIPMTIDLDSLARDIAVLTANRLYSEEEIAAGYDLSPAEIHKLLDDPDFNSRVSAYRDKIGDGRTDLIRAQAKLMSDSNLRDLFELTRSAKEKTSDKLKAMAAIAEIADIKPRNEQQFSGMVLNVDFGSGMTPPAVAQLTPVEVIEHEQP